MNGKTKRIITKLFILGVVISAGLLVLYILTNKTKDNGDKSVFTTGLTKGQQEYFQEQMRQTGTQYGYIKKGQYYLDQGEVNKAIEQFEIAVKNAYSGTTKLEALGNLADAYEKEQNYQKAYDIFMEMSKEYKILPTNKFQIPEEERKKYLKYASKGEFELALEHARLALEAEKKIKDNIVELYQQRLADLIAAKDYILSLKKEPQAGK